MKHIHTTYEVLINSVLVCVDWMCAHTSKYISSVNHEKNLTCSVREADDGFKKSSGP